MMTVRVGLDEKLVTALDRAVKRLNTTRSAFARKALQAVLASYVTQDLERRHREGSLRKPTSARAVGSWEREQS
jgi:metal-responsive CopG/Arc/MetJ family transcriptional regulator